MHGKNSLQVRLDTGIGGLAFLPMRNQKERDKDIAGENEGIHVPRDSKSLAGKVHKAMKDQNRQNAASGAVVHLHDQERMADDHG